MPGILKGYLYRYFLLLLIFPGKYCYGQKCNGDSLFNRFKKDIQFEQQEHQGRVVWDDETVESYCILMINSPIEVLVKYTDDSIPSVRTSIFGGLVHKNADKDILAAILAKHKNDTAEYTESPTDVVITWNVRDFMQTALKLKAENKLTSANYESRLATVRNRVDIVLPGTYHGTIAKDSLLIVDSLIYSKKDVKIVSFTLTLNKDTSFVEEKSANNYLTAEMKKNISESKAGDYLCIDNIMAEFTDNNKRVKRKLASLCLKIN
jgi:hypothetical protein